MYRWRLTPSSWGAGFGSSPLLDSVGSDMELLLELVGVKAITVHDARRCAGLMQKASPGFFHTKIMAEFERRLKEL